MSSSASGQTVKYEFVFTFRPENTPHGDDSAPEVQARLVTDTNDRDAVKEQAWKRAVKRRHESVSAFKSGWQIAHTSIGFANEPWSSWKELRQTLAQFSGVSRVRYEDPYDGTYGPPTYHLRVENGKVDDVVDKVTDYYAGLDVEKRGTMVSVIVDATLS